MAAYRLLVERDALAFLERVGGTDGVFRDVLDEIRSRPLPGDGRFEKTRIDVDGEPVYRVDGERYVALYEVVESEQAVRVLDVVPIDEARRRYGE